MPKVYSIDGITPVVHPSAFVHPSAVLIGDVIVGARIPARALVAGIPARVLRSLPEQELRWKQDNMQLCREPSLFRS